MTKFGILQYAGYPDHFGDFNDMVRDHLARWRSHGYSRRIHPFAQANN